MILPGDVNSLIELFGFTVWMFYGCAMLALIVLRFTRKYETRPYQVLFQIAVMLRKSEHTSSLVYPVLGSYCSSGGDVIVFYHFGHRTHNSGTSNSVPLCFTIYGFGCVFLHPVRL